MEKARLVEVAVLKTVGCKKFGGSSPSFSAKKWRVGRVVIQWPAKPYIVHPMQRFEPFTLRKKFVIDVFDNEETRNQSKNLAQTKWCSGRDGSTCIRLKDEGSRFDSLGHHTYGFSVMATLRVSKTAYASSTLATRAKEKKN
jgi:hypothetical protein